MRRFVLASLVAAAALAGCGREKRRPAPVDATAPEPTRAAPATPPSGPGRPHATLRPLAPAGDLELMSPTEHLVRIALVLAGTRPSAEDVAAVERDPAALGSIVDRYLDAPTFGAVVRDMWHEVLLLRVEGRFVLPRLGPLEGSGTDAEWVREVSEEPLRLIEHVVTHDRPFSEIVTADYAIASDLGLRVWGGRELPARPADAPAPGWKKVAWDSQQPMAGILSSGALWLRHPSNGTNLHRGQAHVIADALLCSGFLDRDVPLFNDIDLSDEDAVRDALKDDPGCVSCHQTLDPLASHLFGFVRVAPGVVKRSYAKGACDDGERGLCYPLAEYRPQQAKQWRKKTGRAPGYFGLASDDLRGLAARIADDPRFSMCAARRFYGYFMQIGPHDVPDATAASLQDALIAADMRVKPLVKAIVMSDDFRARRARAGSPADGVAGRKTTRPEQLARLVADLTGFTWTAYPGNPDKVGAVSLMESDRFGYRAMAGGVEGFQITEPTFAYGPTRALVLQTLAAEAAAHAVERELAAPRPERRLLALVDGDETDEDTVRRQLAALHERVLAERVAPRGPEVDAGYALFRAAAEPRRGWTLVLAALLQDPRIAFH